MNLGKFREIVIFKNFYILNFIQVYLYIFFNLIHAHTLIFTSVRQLLIESIFKTNPKLYRVDLTLVRKGIEARTNPPTDQDLV